MIEEQGIVRRRRRRTAAEIQQIVSEFKGGELTQKEFSRRQGLTLSTLGRYLRWGARRARGASVDWWRWSWQ
jgi:hypothetical protein